MPSTARVRNRRRGRPRATPSHETRARILRAARHCFAETGYARATNKQIAGLALAASEKPQESHSEVLHAFRALLAVEEEEKKT